MQPCKQHRGNLRVPRQITFCTGRATEIARVEIKRARKQLAVWEMKRYQRRQYIMSVIHASRNHVFCLKNNKKKKTWMFFFSRQVSLQVKSDQHRQHKRNWQNKQQQNDKSIKQHFCLSFCLNYVFYYCTSTTKNNRNQLHLVEKKTAHFQTQKWMLLNITD
jgi:hypothetical protein